MTSLLSAGFGSVLIVFDRLFGTFATAPKDEPLQFGAGTAGPTANPLKIVFGVWKEMFADAYRATSATAKLRALFGRP